jgi:hypothetical protein
MNTKFDSGKEFKVYTTLLLVSPWGKEGGGKRICFSEVPKPVRALQLVLLLRGLDKPLTHYLLPPHSTYFRCYIFLLPRRF